MNVSQNARIFVSYSHRGNGPTWKAALLRALQVFETHHLLDVWQDGKIRVSSFWEDDIKLAMSDAQLAVVLLTKEALESEFVLNEEFPYLRDRQENDKLTVFPVVCEECDWRAHDWLRATQAPNGSSPIATLKPEAQERVFRQLATDIAEQLSRVALDELPQGNQSETRLYLDKFPLTRSTGLREEKPIGREQELALLDLTFAQPHTAIVSLVAWGGVGKTMLVQHWLRRLQSEGWFGARRIYAWSFYSQGTTEDRQASEDMFLAHALEWFGVQCEPTLSPWDKGRLLADAVARERTLLILDGIEPLQYPPGPMGGQLRAPGVQSLLKQLARKGNSGQSEISNHKSEIPAALCLVTTREPLTDLADFQRRPNAAWGSVLRVDLGNLTEEAGAALLYHVGAKRAGAAEINADDTELLAVSREVNGHALTLNLLGRFLARAHGGDIRRRDLVKFEEADRQEQGGTTFKMLAAFENWFAKSGEFEMRSLAILRMLGLFDRPADSGCLAALRQPSTIFGLTDPLFHSESGLLGWFKRWKPLPEESWKSAISYLADFGLVVLQTGIDDSERTLDCHPLIREYFAKQVGGQNQKAWRAAHRRLFNYLKDGTQDKPQPTLADLQPLFHAVAHGCQAGLHDDALRRVFWPRIHRNNEYYCVTKLGAFDADLSAAIHFFNSSWRQPIPQLAEVDRALLLIHVGLCLMALGRLSEAKESMRAAIDLALNRKDWKNAAAGGGNLVELELTLGELALSVSQANDSVTLADRSGDPFQRMSKRTQLASAMHQSGRIFDALELFREAETMHSNWQPETPLLYGQMGFTYCELLLAESERAAWQHNVGTMSGGGSLPNGVSESVTLALQCCRDVGRRAAQTLKWAQQYRVSLLVVPLDHLTGARAALYQAVLSQSSLAVRNTQYHAHLAAAMDDFRRASQQQHIPRALLTRAWLRSLEGDTAGARADLDEAWDISERGPMRLHMADIHLHRARLFFREKTYPWKSPQDDLAAAETIINDCGYHRRDEELADAKRAILGA